MKIDVFTICYNEEVLMPYFLRHYLSFCDNVTIFDNGSIDHSLEIARQYSNVKVHNFYSENSFRDDIHKDIKNSCWKKSKADWVIIVDFDEFVYMVPGDTRMNDVTIIEPAWWDMISDKLPTTDGQIYEEINHGRMLKESKAVMFRPSAIKEINYEVGSHTCSPIGDVHMLKTPLISILHYKMLSLEYYLNRTKFLASRLSEMNKKKGWGFHYNFPEEQIIEYYKETWKIKKKIAL